jgi:hypothetical protein
LRPAPKPLRSTCTTGLATRCSCSHAVRLRAPRGVPRDLRGRSAVHSSVGDRGTRTRGSSTTSRRNRGSASTGCQVFPGATPPNKVLPPAPSVGEQGAELAAWVSSDGLSGPATVLLCPGRGCPVGRCTSFQETCARRWSATSRHSMPGTTSRLWLATSSSAGSRTRSRRRPENAAFGGRRKNWRKAADGPAAGRGASIASAPAGRGRRRSGEHVLSPEA